MQECACVEHAFRPRTLLPADVLLFLIPLLINSSVTSELALD